MSRAGSGGHSVEPGERGLREKEKWASGGAEVSHRGASDRFTGKAAAA